MAVVDFFLGANSPNGFVSLFDQITSPEWKSYLIKGTPGNGKSTLLHTIFDAISPIIFGIQERIHCSSDPDSWDAVVFHQCALSLADATAPHTISPVYPVAAETEVSLYGCVDPAIVLDRKEEIMTASAQTSLLARRSQNFLHAANALLKDNFCMALEHTDIEKVNHFARRVCLKEIPKGNRRGVEHRRFLSAVTPRGIVSYPDTVSALCDRIYVIQDEYGCASRLLLHVIRSYGLEQGQEMFSCFCPLDPHDKLEHLLFPDLRLGFVTLNRYHTLPETSCRTIHASRFTDQTKMKSRRQRLGFNRKAARELIQESVQTLQWMEQFHQLLEDLYCDAVDFDSVSEITCQLEGQIQWYLQRQQA